MKVLVTGGAGRVGQATTERLLRHGWDVRVIGLESGVEIPGAEFITCDILNYAAVREQMRGCQVVVHLAAIASTVLAPGPQIFQVNAAGTFNIFEAAAAEGIKRIVQASSINAFGCAYSLVEMPIQYFPIDEAHPTYTTDPYSFSKGLIEDIGAYYWRRDGISSVAMRFPGVFPSTIGARDSFRQSRRETLRLLDELTALPDAERNARLDAARRTALEFRKKRPYEYVDHPLQSPAQALAANFLDYVYTQDRYNFWAFVDERDAAQSLEKGLTAEYEGAHALFINAPHNWLDTDSRTLTRLFFPDVSDSNVKLSGSESLVSLDKARKLIGFEPEYSVEMWKD